MWLDIIRRLPKILRGPLGWVVGGVTLGGLSLVAARALAAPKKTPPQPGEPDFMGPPAPDPEQVGPSASAAEMGPPRSAMNEDVGPPRSAMRAEADPSRSAMNTSPEPKAPPAPADRTVRPNRYLDADAQAIAGELANKVASKTKIEKPDEDVRQFQDAAGLEADGLYGWRTKAALEYFSDLPAPAVVVGPDYAGTYEVYS